MLARVILVAVSMTAIDHDPCRQAGRCKLRDDSLDTLAIIVGLVSAAQNYMPPGIARCRNNGGPAVLVHAEERVRRPRGPDRINGSIDVPVCGVLEAHRH